MNSDLLTVKLDKLTYGGDALGRLPDATPGAQGRAVFVPFALPGETVRARLVEEKRGHLRAELVEVLQPVPERILPRCKHFGICGGCAYQHISYPDQLRAKTGILRDQLVRIGKFQNPPLDEDMVPSPLEWNYRNNLQFHLSPQGKLGYIGANDRGFVPISECHLPEAILDEVWPQLEFDSDLGLDRVSLRAGTDGERMLILESHNPELPELELEASLSVIHLTGEDALVLAGDDALNISVNGRTFHISAASFFQVNTHMAGKMVEYLLDHLPFSPATTLLDVYCGVGLFSAFFAGRVKRVLGVEVSPSACDDYSINLDEFDNVELYQAPAELVLPILEVSPDVVILDPPRAGLDKRALDALLALSPACIAYVSCDPSTLSRDLARLVGGGYRLVRITPFDLFPQTYSIESISILEKG